MIVDAHLHLLNSKNFKKNVLENLGLTPPTDTSIDEIICWLNIARVDKAIIMGQDTSRIQNSFCGEEGIIDAVKKNPEKIIGLASIEPLDRYNRINKMALEYFERAIIEYGLCGLLLTPPFGHYRSNDRRVYPFYEKAVELNVPVQFHHSAAPGPAIIAPFKYANISLLNDVCIDFPDLKIIIEHLAYPWTEELLVMMSSNKKIYADISSLYDRPTILAWNLVMAKEYGVIDRIMYASDYFSRMLVGFSEEPANNFKKYIDWVQNGLNLIVEKTGWPKFLKNEIDGILGDNAARLYKL